MTVIIDKDFTENELLAELQAAYALPELDPARHTTVAMAQAVLHCGKDVARKLLDAKVQAGAYKWITVRKPQGRTVQAVVKVD